MVIKIISGTLILISVTMGTGVDVRLGCKTGR
jgi:hypothetical protein